MNMEKSKKDLPIIVIGAGSVGIHFVHKLFHNNPSSRIKIFGGENTKPYVRENLSKLLSGEMTEKELYSDSELPDSKHIQTFFNNPITQIDTKKSLVIDSDGLKHPYENLVLAMGSLPLIPDIKGLNLKNVIVFRNLQDAEALLCRQVSSRNTLVIGGGQVGLDAAHAMNRHNTNVSVIEHRKRLMFNQLDHHASIYLRLYLDDVGIDVRVETTVDEIKGKNDKITHVILDDGERVDCDTVIISIGIKPKTELAQKAGLKVSRGVVVDDYLQTNHDNIFAIGECAEHNSHLYTTVEPGYEQARVLANNLAGRKSKKYNGSITTTQFKVVDYPFLTIGESSDQPENRKELIYRDIKKMTYRKLVLEKGHLHGAIAAGSWEYSEKLQKAVDKKQFIWPWQRSHFVETGEFG